MSRQFSAYLVNGDLDDISALLHELGARFLTPSSSPIDPLRELERLRELRAYLVRQEDLGDLVFRPLGDGPETVVDGLRSPVIEVDRSVLHAGRLSRGRLYVVTRYWSDGEIIEKGQGFLAWADQVFRAVKQRLGYARSLRAYCGKEAAELFAQVPDAAGPF